MPEHGLEAAHNIILALRLARDPFIKFNKVIMSNFTNILLMEILQKLYQTLSLKKV